MNHFIFQHTLIKSIAPLNASRHRINITNESMKKIIEPTIKPTIEPIIEPTIEQTIEQTIEPIIEPTIKPSFNPTFNPIFKRNTNLIIPSEHKYPVLYGVLYIPTFNNKYHT
jgi:hypothetical protein